MKVQDLTKEDYKRKHIESYKKALMEIVTNNNKALVEEDILSLIKKPPLDSMDVIKTKLLSLAKVQGIVLDGDMVDKVISTYRNKLSKEIVLEFDIRKETFINKIEKFSPSKDAEVLKVDLKDFNDIDKKIKSSVKKNITSCIDNYRENNLNIVFKNNAREKEKLQINKQFSKFLKTTYRKKVVDDIEIKLIVKNRTLINGINEQGERYLFTLEKSYLLK